MGGLGGLGAGPEQNVKRRRLERDTSRSGQGSGTDDENFTADEMVAMVATPEDTTDSMQAFNISRLEAPRSAGAGSPGPSSFLMPIKLEQGMEALPGGQVAKRESDIGVSVRGEPANGGAAGAGEGVETKDGVLTDSLQTSGAYCAREANLKMEEDAGRLKFECYPNDGVEQHMIWLVGLKNIFARQLPNMPKEYIVRLVLDRSHKSMMIIKNNLVVGGITYRPYLQQKFGEIAFCAITAMEQVKGYGTRLMNHLKQHARDVDGLTHFLTYADNNAVGYFTKQGFTKSITLEEERWKGYIKDYDGGTLMECVVDPVLPYTDLPHVIKRQRQAIDEKIRELSNCRTVFPGLDLHKNEVGVPRRPIRLEDIPGLKMAGWSPDQCSTARLRLTSLGPDVTPNRTHLHALMRSMHKAVSEHQDAWPFKEPVNPKEVADYYDVIKDPIDLKTMMRRLESEVFYIHLEMFVADMRRMFGNAMKYNSPDTIYYKAAKRLEAMFMNKLKASVILARPTGQGI